MLLKCRVCRQEKEESEFHRGSANRSGRQTACKPCTAQYAKDHRRKHKRKLAAQAAAYYADNRAARLKYGRAWKLLSRYKITVDEYVRRCTTQKNLCPICRKPPRGKYKNLVVDHDHKTQEVRGLLCHRCNRALGLFDEDVETIFRAVQYLRGLLGE